MADTQSAQNEVNMAVNSLISQFAELKFEGMLMYGVFLILSLIICFEGYKLYRLALLLMGFAVGYQLTHNVLEIAGIPLTDEQKLMAQAIVGIVFAVISTTVVKWGVFLATYFFAKHALAVPIAQAVMNTAKEKVTIPAFLVPVITTVIGLIAAYIIAKLAADSLRPVIVLLTAAMGGFALVNNFISMVPYFPYDLSFILSFPAIITVGAKLFMTAAGVGIQGLKED